VLESQQVTSFMDCFAFRSLPEEFGVFGQSVVGGIQTMEGEDARVAAQVGFSDHEGEDGGEEIHIGYAENADLLLPGQGIE